MQKSDGDALPELFESIVKLCFYKYFAAKKSEYIFSHN